MSVTCQCVCKNNYLLAHSCLTYVLSLQEFAGDGLRTLALAYKDLDEDYFKRWKQRHHEASTELEDRESKLELLYEEIEMDLLVGQDTHSVHIDWIFQVFFFHLSVAVLAAAGSDGHRRQVTGQSTRDN